jgi:gluconokinase
VIVVLMGVAGSGKTTVGAQLAAALGWPFYDADDLHTQESREKMARGVPLTDEDRRPWLSRLRALLVRLAAAEESAVLACSALKQRYRELLFAEPARVELVYLRGDRALLRRRLKARRGHFASAALLKSQLEALEEPADALVLGIEPPPEAIVAEIRRRLSLG